MCVSSSLFPTMHLFMADIANPDLFVCGCRTWICIDIALKMVNRSPPPPLLGP